MAKPQPKSKKNTKIKKSNIAVFYLIAALISFAVYYNSLSNDFVFDDDSVVLGDPTIMTHKSIPKYFTGEQGFHKVIGRYYRPVVSTSYAIDYAFWEFKPFGFHLTNVFIHVINVLLFFLLLRLMFEKSQSPFKDYAILIGALIFAVHPIHSEAVAWVSGRTDSLSCTFFFAAFIYYLKYSKKQNTLNFVLTLLFYLLSLLAKEMAITLPIVIILYDALVNRVNFRKELKQKAGMYSGLAVLSILYFVLRWAVLHDTPQRESYLYFYQKDFATTVYTMIQTIPLYFRLAVAPYGMLYHYSGYMPYQSAPFVLPVLFALGFMAVIAYAVFYFYKRNPFLAYGLLFFFITLVPVLNIVPTMNFMADRFLYIPSVFLSIIAVAVILKYYSEKTVNIIYGISAAVLIIYGYMTISRNADWKTNEELFLSAEGRPGTVTYVNIGNIYANKGQFDIAEQYYRKALDLRSELVIANNNLGKVFMVKGNFDSAYYYMNKAYMLDTLSPEPMHTFAQLYTRFEKLPEAISWLEKIEKVTPGYMNSDKMLQELKMRQQMMQNPVTDKNGQQNINPEVNQNNAQKISILESSSYKNYQAKNFAKAIEELSELIKLNPPMASGYYNNIGMCYLDQAKYNEALESFNQSVKIEPKFSTGFNNIGQCYEKMGNMEKAKEFYQKAVEADPNNQEAVNNVMRLK